VYRATVGKVLCWNFVSTFLQQISSNWNMPHAHYIVLTFSWHIMSFHLAHIYKWILCVCVCVCVSLSFSLSPSLCVWSRARVHLLSALYWYICLINLKIAEPKDGDKIVTFCSEVEGIYTEMLALIHCLEDVIFSYDIYRIIFDNFALPSIRFATKP